MFNHLQLTIHIGNENMKPIFIGEAKRQRNCFPLSNGVYIILRA